MYDDRLRAVWETELDRLELDVIRAERLLKGLANLPTDPWDPPQIPGQMPADLAARAQELLDRQECAKVKLSVALSDAQRQIGYADRVSEVSGRAHAAPVYLDLEA